MPWTAEPPSADGLYALEWAAYEVMARRRWVAGWSSEGGPRAWFVYGRNGYKWNPIGGPGFFHAADPFSALVAADEWYRANVEAKDQRKERP